MGEKETLAEIIEGHYPMESAGGEPGDAGCSCDEPFGRTMKHGYTWKGYCEHLAEVITAAREQKPTPRAGE